MDAVPSQTNSTSGDSRKRLVSKLLPLGKWLVVLLVAYFLGTLIFLNIQDWLAFDPLSLLAGWVMLFILAIGLRINYTSRLFIVALVLVTGLLGLYSFGQALVMILLVIGGEKLLKLI